MRNIYRGQKIADAIHFELEIDAQLIIWRSQVQALASPR